MAYLSGITFCGRDGNKALLCGYAKALTAGKKYCLKYLIYGDDEYNMPNSSLSYTFVSGGGDFNLTSNGCYLPNVPDGEYGILLVEVGVNCEDFINLADSTSVSIYAEPPPAETRWLNITSIDLSGNRIPAVAFRLRNLDTGEYLNFSTDINGYFERQFDVGNYQIYPEVPSGYSAMASSYAVSLFIDKYVVLEFKKTAEASCFFNVSVTDTDTATPVSGVNIVCDSSMGGHFEGVTDASGNVTVEVVCGHTYHITGRKDGYEDVGIFKSVTSGTALAALATKKISTEPCPSASAYFEFDRRVAGVGEDITVTGKRLHNDTVQPFHKWYWGDGTITTDQVTKHAYSTPGTYTVRHEVENTCGSVDTVSGVVTISEDATHKLNAPIKVYVGVPFGCDVQSDPNREFVIRALHFLQEYGRGTTDSSGAAHITCTVTEPGAYTVVGFSAGGGYAGGLTDIETNPVEFNATTEAPPIAPDDLTLSIPTLVIAGEVNVSGTAPLQNQKLEICASKKFFGFDFLAADDVLAAVTSDAEYKYNAVLELDEFGIIEVYSRIPKDWWDVLTDDITTAKHTVFVLTWEIIIFLIIAAALVYDKKTGKLGLLKRKR